MVKDDGEWWGMVENSLELCEIARNGFVGNDGEWCGMLKNPVKWCGIVENAVEMW